MVLYRYRRFRILFLLFTLLFLWITFLSSPVAHADGGAPNLAYVSGTPKGVSVVDVQQQKVTGTISIPGEPSTVALSLDGRFLYVTQPALNKVSIIAAKTGSAVCSVNIPGRPDLLVFDSNVGSLYTAGSGTSNVTVLDATNCKVKRVIQTAGAVSGLAFAAIGTAGSGGTGDQLWVANPSSVSIFDDISGKMLGTVSVPQGPRYLSIPPGATVYAATAKGTVVAIDLNSPYTVTPLISGGDYGPMDYDASTGEVYVPDRKNDQFVILTPVNAGFKVPKEPNRVLKVDARPASIAITNDGQLGFGALDNGSVVLYDIPARQLIITVPTGGSPRFIITGVYPPAFGTTPQQATLFEQVANIIGYLIVAALLIVPIILFRRYSRKRVPKDNEQKAVAPAPDLPPVPEKEDFNRRL